MIIRTRNEFGEVVSAFRFYWDTWKEIGGTGTGPDGHYSEQGYRTLYASPRVSRLLKRHRFVLHGTGYYGASITTGLSWGTEAREIGLDEARDIMDSKYLEKYGQMEIERLD